MSHAAHHSGKVRVSVVEDDDDIRQHLVLLLVRSGDFELVSQHPSGEDAVRNIPENPPDVVVMDINLPGLKGTGCVRQLKLRVPGLQFLMLTVYEDSEQIFESLRAGASGYLLKRTPAKRILEAIREVHQGGSPMTSHIARKVVQYFNQIPRPAPEIASLSDREREVLHELSRGRLYKEIADSLGVSLDTVRKHLQSIYQKLHVHSRTEAVVKYLYK